MRNFLLVLALLLMPLSTFAQTQMRSCVIQHSAGSVLDGGCGVGQQTLHVKPGHTFKVGFGAMITNAGTSVLWGLRFGTYCQGTGCYEPAGCGAGFRFTANTSRISAPTNYLFPVSGPNTSIDSFTQINSTTWEAGQLRLWTRRSITPFEWDFGEIGQIAIVNAILTPVTVVEVDFSIPADAPVGESLITVPYAEAGGVKSDVTCGFVEQYTVLPGVRVVVEGDADGDNVLDPYDNCPQIANAPQTNSEGGAQRPWRRL